MTLCAGKSVHGGSRAELLVASVLAMVRDIPTYVRQQQSGTWEKKPPRTVSGAGALILGAGTVGRRVGELFSALGAEVDFVAKSHRPGVHPLEELPRLMPSADVLAITLPLTAETAGLIDSSALAMLPDGAIVANVGRGPIVDTDALADEVGSGRLRCVLDVTDPEPLPSGHRLWRMSGALITPHASGGALGWESRGAALIADQLERLEQGRPLSFVVDGDY